MTDPIEAVVTTDDTPAPLAAADDLTPAALIQLAITSGVADSTLQTLQKMWHAEQDRAAARAFHAAMAQFHSRCPPIARTKWGGGDGVDRQGVYRPGKYKYAPLDTILAAVVPLMTELGLSHRWSTEVDGERMTVTCYLSHVDGHVETSQVIVPVARSDKVINAQQGMGKSVSYGKRYSLESALGITATDDIDAAGPDHERVSDETLDPEQCAAVTSALAIADKSADRLCAHLSGKWQMRVECVEAIPAEKFDEVMALLRIP